MTSASLMPLTHDAGDPMVIASVRPRFADITAPSPRAPADDGGSRAARWRQIELPASFAPLITVARSTGEPVAMRPRSADTAGLFTRPAAAGSALAGPLRQAEPAMTSASLTPLTHGAAELMALAPLRPRSSDPTEPTSLDTTGLEIAGRQSGVAGTNFVGLLSPPVSGVSTPRPFAARRAAFPSGSRDANPTEPRRSDLPLRVVSRLRGVAMPPVGSGAVGAPIHLAAPIVAERAEAPGSAAHPRAFPPVPALEVPVPANVGSVTEASARADRAEAAPDPDDIVERAWRELMSRLAIEQERRGFGRWA
jgi:hypothetical protein